MRYFLSLMLLLSFLPANTIDEHYTDINTWIAQTLQKLDIFISDSNESIKQRFTIRTSLDTVLETKQVPQFKFNIKADLEFPRTQKRLHLFIQDYKKYDTVDDLSGKNIEDSIDNTSFLFGLQYLTFAHISYKAGIRFHKITPDPFMAIGWEHTLYFNKYWLYFGNELRYFLDRKIDNKAFANYQYKLSPIDIFSFENSYRYRQKPDSEHQVVHALKIYHALGEQSLFIPHTEVYCFASKTSSYRVGYFYLGFDYMDTFYRKWLFYQISPAVLWRYENSFAPSYRLMFRFGIRFEQH